MKAKVSKNQHDVGVALQLAVEPFVERLAKDLTAMLAEHAEHVMAIASQSAIARVKAELDAHAVTERPSVITMTLEQAPAVEPKKPPRRAQARRVVEAVDQIAVESPKVVHRDPKPDNAIRGVCSKCKQAGHNARSCGREPKGHRTALIAERSDLKPPPQSASRIGSRESRPLQPRAEPSSDADDEEGPGVELVVTKTRRLERVQYPRGDRPGNRWRLARGNVPRAKSLPQNRGNKRVIFAIGAGIETPDVERPVVREDCSAFARPCPFVACKHHLYLDVNPETGTIKINFPDLEPWELSNSCSLDVAERGGLTLEEVGEIMNLTCERVRQVEVRGFHKLRAACAERDIHDDALGAFPHPQTNEAAA